MTSSKIGYKIGDTVRYVKNIVGNSVGQLNPEIGMIGTVTQTNSIMGTLRVQTLIGSLTFLCGEVELVSEE